MKRGIKPLPPGINPAGAPVLAVRVPRTTFFGRTAELRRIAEVLAGGTQLVTLTGAGGIGKTRLALEVLFRHAQDLARGAAFCDAAPARNLAGLCSAVAAAVGLELLRPGDPVAAVGEALGRRDRPLLVIDNVEQVASDAARALDAWLDMAPGMQFLVTSRETLRIPGEVVVQVPALAVPEPRDADAMACDSVKMLVDRCRLASESFDPRSSLPTLQKIASQLDGHPLALELAASRIPMMSAQQLLEHMTHRFDVLKGGPRTADQRHRTLAATLDWSWNLLTDAERSALAQGAVFEGPFSGPQAAAVMTPQGGSPLDALDVLTSLHHKSLLRVLPGAQPCFVMDASIREYGRLKLNERTDATQVHQRHAACFLGAGRALYDRMLREGTALLPRLAEHSANIVCVHRHAVAHQHPDALEAAIVLGPVFSQQGQLWYHLQMLEQALVLPCSAEGSPWRRVEALTARGYALRKLGDTQRAQADFSECLRVLAELPHQGLKARVLGNLGSLAVELGTLQPAWQHLSAAVELAHAAGDTAHEGVLRSGLGRVQHNLRTDPEQTQRMYEAACALHRQTGDLRAEARTLARLGFLRQDLGALDDAQKHYLAALETAQQAGCAGHQALAWLYLGNLARQQGQIEQAARFYADAVRMLRQVGDVHFEGIAEMDRGILAAISHQPANGFFETALQLLTRVGDRRCVAMVHAHMGALAADQGHMDVSERCFAQAEAAMAGSGDRVLAPLLRGAQTHRLVARAVASLEGGDGAAASVLRRDALAALVALEQEAASPVGRSQHLELMAGRLRDAIWSLWPPEHALVLAPDFRWMQAPHQQRLDLGDRPQIAQVLRLLVQRRQLAPGQATAAVDLCAAAWPGDRSDRASLLNRLRVAMTTLRRMGLRDLLMRDNVGYWLDPSVPVVVARSSSMIAGAA